MRNQSLKDRYTCVALVLLNSLTPVLPTHFYPISTGELSHVDSDGTSLHDLRLHGTSDQPPNLR